MKSTLTLVKKELPKKKEETQLQYKDRTYKEAYLKLNDKKRTKKEEKEFKEIEEHCLKYCAVHTDQLIVSFADKGCTRTSVERIYAELVDQFGDDTPQKTMLIHRLVHTWNQLWSYDYMFSVTKYRPSDDGGHSFEYSADKTRYLGELRRGIESANDQIMRLTQALQNLVSPPITVKATNAIIAQNMQFNQGVTPKDLGNVTESINYEEVIS